MERRHFELEQGYLNLNVEALMFTRSGNWQDAARTRERKAGAAPGRLARNTVGIMLLLLGGGFFAGGKLRGSDPFPLFGPVLLGLGICSFFGKVQHDFAPSFRIPFSKVLGLDHRNDPLETRI